MQKRGIALTVVTMPLLADWSRAFRRRGQGQEAAGGGNSAKALADTRASVFWDAWAEAPLDGGESSYTDAFHLRWSAARRLHRTPGGRDRLRIGKDLRGGDHAVQFRNFPVRLPARGGLFGFFALGLLDPQQESAVVWLTLTSLVFYGWWNPGYLPLLIVSVVMNLHWIGRLLARHRSRRLLILGITLNLAALGYYKYAGFLAETVDTLFALWDCRSRISCCR